MSFKIVLTVDFRDHNNRVKEMKMKILALILFLSFSCLGQSKECNKKQFEEETAFMSGLFGLDEVKPPENAAEMQHYCKYENLSTNYYIINF